MMLSSLPDAVVACATGASFTAVTVIVPVAVLLETKPLLSVALYWKLVLPFQSAFGLKQIVAPFEVAVITSVVVNAVPVPAELLQKLPLAGSVLSLKLATVPSTSVPLRLTAMMLSSLPDAVVACATGASFTAVTVTGTVTVVLPPLPSATVTSKLSEPLQLAFGVQVQPPVAGSMLTVP